MDYIFSPVITSLSHRRQNVLNKGDKRWYWSPLRGIIEVVIIGIHHDAGEPYYTIKLPDGNVKGTIQCRLFNTAKEAYRSIRNFDQKNKLSRGLF